MTVLRLELDIDSDVYPELHANLAVMLNAGGRSERVRQLGGRCEIFTPGQGTVVRTILPVK